MTVPSSPVFKPSLFPLAISNPSASPTTPLSWNEVCFFFDIQELVVLFPALQVSHCDYFPSRTSSLSFAVFPCYGIIRYHLFPENALLWFRFRLDIVHPSEFPRLTFLFVVQGLAHLFFPADGCIGLFKCPRWPPFCSFHPVFAAGLPICLFDYPLAFPPPDNDDSLDFG